MSPCLFVLPIITQEPLDECVSNFGWDGESCECSYLGLKILISVSLLRGSTVSLKAGFPSLVS